MTDNEKQTAIAVAHNKWTLEEAKRGFSTVDRQVDGVRYKQISERVPDYLNDLNAMRDALLQLDDKQAIRYRCILTQAALDRNFDPMMASAIDQADAFLKAIGRP